MPRRLEISPPCLMWEELWVGAFVQIFLSFCSYLETVCWCVCIVCVLCSYLLNTDIMISCVHVCSGGILAGVISDKLGKRATTCAVMLLLAAPTVSFYCTVSLIHIMKLGPKVGIWHCILECTRHQWIFHKVRVITSSAITSNNVGFICLNLLCVFRTVKKM